VGIGEIQWTTWLVLVLVITWTATVGRPPILGTIWKLLNFMAHCKVLHHDYQLVFLFEELLFWHRSWSFFRDWDLRGPNNKSVSQLTGLWVVDLWFHHHGINLGLTHGEQSSNRESWGIPKSRGYPQIIHWKMGFSIGFSMIILGIDGTAHMFHFGLSGSKKDWVLNQG